MRRAAIERPRTLKAWRLHNRIAHGGMDTACPCDRQPGRFRKRRATGCHRPRCWLCRSSKLMGDPTLREVRVMITFREDIAGLDCL